MVYGANPNLIYMQSTAMGEALYLALFVWAVVYFSESVRGDAKALTKCGFCLAAACLTRYDGWFLAAAMAARRPDRQLGSGQCDRHSSRRSSSSKSSTCSTAKFIS